MKRSTFEWHEPKNVLNVKKHGVSFGFAQAAFDDPLRVIIRDMEHSNDTEERFFCIGKVEDEILTVRFTYRKQRIRIYGAGYWRGGKKRYEQENGLQ